MKFIIETYGCQMNVADSELISSILINAGHTPTENINEAQIIIFNTCSVRENAESRVIGRISSEVARKNFKTFTSESCSIECPNTKTVINNSIIIGVVGCMAQRLGKELSKINKKLDFVVGVDQYCHLPQIIDLCIDKNDFIENTALNHFENYTDLYPLRSNSLNAFITIMRGCNNFCTYCIVPFTRGRERSRPIKEILNEIEMAGKAGAYEITLLGQNVNSYTFENFDFPDLLVKANKIDTIKRLRFVTSHPKDLSDKLIEVMANCEKVCEHIHLPLQSGNNAILSKMNRKYTAQHYLELIQKLRNSIPDIAITTDVIAGFPSETEEQFIDTLNLMKEIKFDFAYMFKYSERSGTKAVDFEKSVPEEIRLDRLKRLIDMQTEITTQKYKNRIGAHEEIYVESVSKKDVTEMSGKTRDFKITVFKGNESLLHKFVNVKIIDAVGWTLKGALLENEFLKTSDIVAPIPKQTQYKNLHLIVAVDENWAIGYKNDLLLKIPEDMKYFKQKTLNNIVVMGRKTFESLPNKKPLKNRTNIIITKNKDYKIDGAKIVHEIYDVLNLAKNSDKEIFIIGGEMIYNLFLPYCKRAFITKIYHTFEADKHIPDFVNTHGWELIDQSEIFHTEIGIKYQFQVYQSTIK